MTNSPSYRFFPVFANLEPAVGAEHVGLLDDVDDLR